MERQLSVRTDHPGKGLDVEFLGFLSRHQNQCRCTVVEVRRVGSCDHTSGLERRLEGGNLVENDLLVLFIFLDNRVPFLALDDDGSNLVIEDTLFPCPLGAFIRLDGMRIQRFASDLILLGGGLSTVAHSEVVVNIPETIALYRVLRFELTVQGVSSG